MNFALQDLSLFLPLWAQIPDRIKASELTEKNLLPKFLTDNGLINNYFKQDVNEKKPALTIDPLWNYLIIDGLISYGFNNEAMQIFSNLMACIIADMKENKALHARYIAENGKPLEGKNSVRGCLPIQLFLRLNGIDFLNENMIILKAGNPFPSPITVKYRGTKITCETDETIIQFLSGEKVHITEKEPQIIQLL